MSSWMKDRDERLAAEARLAEIDAALIKSAAGPVRELIVEWLRGAHLVVGHVDAESSVVIIRAASGNVSTSIPGSSVKSQSDVLKSLFDDPRHAFSTRLMGDLALVTDEATLNRLTPNRSRDRSELIAKAVACPEIRKALAELAARGSSAMSDVASKRKAARLAKARTAFRACLSRLRRIGYDGAELKQFLVDEVDLIEVEKVMHV